MTFAQLAGLPTGQDRVELAWFDALRNEPTWLVFAAAAIAALVAWAIWMYWRERHAMAAPVWMGLLALRLVAIAGIVAFLLGPQLRTAKEVRRASRVAVLVDSSLSMVLPTDGGETQHRSAAAARLLLPDGLLDSLRETHAVSVGPTDGGGAEISLAKLDAKSDEAPPALDEDELQSAIRPASSDTRLGDAILRTLETHAGQPLAGIVLLTDGQHNAGAAPTDAAALAAEANVRLLTVGFGSTQPGSNLRVREIIAPSRAYPNDEIEISAVIEVAGKPLGGTTVSLFRRLDIEPADANVLLESQSLDTTAVESPHTVPFTVTPETPGRYVYTVRVALQSREERQDDNQRDATVEVVDRVTKVLLWAGGPGRDYRFLRNQLKRDEAFEVDVLLESAPEGAIQDARRLLRELPGTAEDWDAYDAIVAIDPDWHRLSEDAAARIEDWISNRGGGLLYVAGSVNTPRWIRRGAPATVRRLLPVTLPDRIAMLLINGSASASTEASRLRLTRAGLDADYLWIAGGREASAAAWNDFAGFYGVGAVESVRPGATVLAASGRDDDHVAIAEQYFGSGLVAYLGSSELWRLRGEDPDYFSTLTANWLRHLSQGRLLAKSPGGSLTFDRSRYDVGDTLTLRAMLPGRSADNTSLLLRFESPAGDIENLPLQPSETQQDIWMARVAARDEGEYTATLDLGGSAPLVATTEVQVPSLERDRPLRNESLLANVAKAGGGWYYPTAEAAFNGLGEAPAIAAAIPSREETRTLYSQPNPVFARRVSQWLLAVIAAALLLEWLGRRLARLA